MRRPDRRNPASALGEAEQLTLRIEKLVYGGAGLARDQGRVVFTPFTLPGELVSATVSNTHKGFAEASLVQIIEASASRAAPPCPHFGVCGGCHYQHAEYAAQTAIKAAILEETLTRSGPRDLPPITTHSGAPLGYRNRIRLHLDPDSSALGYRERGAHRLLVVRQCPIAMPVLERALAALQAISAAEGWGSRFAEVELSTNNKGSEVLMLLRQRGRERLGAQTELARSCERLRAALPELAGARVLAASAVGRGERFPAVGRAGRASRGVEDQHVREADSVLAQWGVPSMLYRVAEREYRVSAGAFFQVNQGLVETLVELATDGRSGTLAWDLYAGVGLFSLALAERFTRVVAVESAPSSAGDLRANLEPVGETSPGPCTAVKQSTLNFLRAQQSRGQSQPGMERDAPRSARFDQNQNRPDFVLVDPPRSGLGAEMVSLLVQFRAKHITYVSCDPATLSRDLRLFVESGYRLEKLHLIDLFPQTFHLETVVVLSLV